GVSRGGGRADRQVPYAGGGKPRTRGAARELADLLLATRDLRLVGVDEERLLDDRSKAPRAGTALERPLRDRSERMVAKLEFDPFHGEEFLVLLHEGVLGLREDLHERVRVELVQDRHDRQASHELRDQA